MILSLSLTSCKSKNKDSTSDGNNSTVNDEKGEEQLPDNNQSKPDGKGKIAFAEMIDFYRIQYRILSDATDSQSTKGRLHIKVFDGERAVTVLNITVNDDSLTGIIELAEKLDITKSYSLVIDGYGEKTVIPTFVFDTEDFIRDYSYQGGDLGAMPNGDTTTFKVWAPTASQVTLNLYSSYADSSYLSVDMTKCDKGVWSYTAECGHGTYYTYSVTTQIGTNEAADPYAKATSFNGERGMVVDLTRTNPDGWGEDFQAKIDSYADAVIWGVNPEEFSDASEFNYNGYLAFTERGLVNASGESIGVDYLVNLGITHVNLLPVYEFDSHIGNKSQSNYGTDNYNSPNANFSSNLYCTDVAIKEYKEMVKALHDAGIGVIMSVDYAHTDKANTSFDKIVPYYYYRYTTGGISTSSSGCGRDTASERYMFSKFITDSLYYLADEYDLDGFSFETLYLHGIKTIDNIEKTIHAVNPEAMIIGKCSATGTGAKEISALTHLEHAIGGIAVFNDTMSQGFINTVFGEYENSYADSFSSVLDGLKGIIADEYGDIESSSIVNRINLNNQSSWIDASEEDKLSSLRLYLTFLMASKASIYIRAGEEFSLTDNKGIDWSRLQEESAERSMMLYCKEIFRIRKGYGIFANPDSIIYANLLTDTIAIFVINTATNEKALIISNPTSEKVTYTLDGIWYMIANGADAETEGIETCEGKITVPAYTAIVLTNSIFTSN